MGLGSGLGHGAGVRSCIATSGEPRGTIKTSRRWHRAGGHIGHGVTHRAWGQVLYCHMGGAKGHDQKPPGAGIVSCQGPCVLKFPAACSMALCAATGVRRSVWRMPIGSNGTSRPRPRRTCVKATEIPQAHATGRCTFKEIGQAFALYCATVSRVARGAAMLQYKT